MAVIDQNAVWAVAFPEVLIDRKRALLLHWVRRNYAFKTRVLVGSPRDCSPSEAEGLSRSWGWVAFFLFTPRKSRSLGQG